MNPLDVNHMTLESLLILRKQSGFAILLDKGYGKWFKDNQSICEGWI